MARVGIAACGITAFSMKRQKIESVLLECAKSLLDESPVERKKIDAVLVSTNSNSKYLAPIVSEMAGIAPKTAHSVENLCNSGTNAIVSAYSYVASGLADTVLVCGAELHDSPGRVLEWDNARGEYKHPVFWASMFSSAYKREFGATDEQLAVVPAKNHRQAQNNPNAISERAYSVREVMDSERLSEDLRLLDCSRPCTGGASVLLASEEAAKGITDSPVWISGIGQKTTSGGFTKNQSLTFIESARAASEDALAMSGRRIGDIDAAEVHDAFSVCEPMALESLGFAKRGTGLEMIKELYDAENPMINPRGGLIGAGHPLGATGIAQAVEIVQQLTSEAGGRQVSGAKTGMIHNMSAGATSSTVLVLER